MTGAIAARKAALADAALDARLAFETRRRHPAARGPRPQGTIHPVSQVLDEITAIFADLGFRVAEGPDVEYDDYNFTKLNIPPDHPARQMHDTFYVAPQADGSRHVLRTHTSPVQVRTMLTQKPPIRIISPGRTYRVRFRRHPFADVPPGRSAGGRRGHHLGHLKWAVEEFCKAFFEVDKIELRARPSLLPVHRAVAWNGTCAATAPAGRSNSARAMTGWSSAARAWCIPSVLENCGIDPERYQGFAFGFGLDRHGDAEIRHARHSQPFFESDLRWLQALRLRRPRHPDAGRRAQPMKFTLSWLKDHLDTDADAQTDRRQADQHRPGSRSIEDPGAA